jgi:hypothetical protein
MVGRAVARDNPVTSLVIPATMAGVEEVDLDVIRAWWSLRSLRAVRWLIEHGFDPWRPGCEVDVLRSRL